jgi:hypothetical protein
MQEMSVEPDLIHLDRLSRSRCYPNDRIRKQPDFRLAKSVAATEVASMEQTVRLAQRLSLRSSAQYSKAFGPHCLEQMKAFRTLKQWA